MLDPQAQAELAQLAIDLANDSKIGKSVKKRISELQPSRRFFDVEADELRETMQQEFTKRDQDEEARKIRAHMENERNALLNSGHTPDNVTAIEDVMTKYGLSDYKAAAKLWAAEQPAKRDNEQSDRTWTLPTVNKEEDYSIKHARSKAYQVIDELRSKK
jgi:hypothetical protein